MNIPQLLLRLLKVGVIGFGGGSALIPIVRQEMVVDSQAMSEDDYLKHTVVANITPGALPVKLGATCGYQLTRPVGSLLGAYAVVFPGVFGTVLILALFSFLGEKAIHYLNHASLGITIFIVFLLMNYVGKTVKTGNARANALICASAFLLTGGRVVREIVELLLGLPAHSLGHSLFALSMINVMILSFFLIFSLQLARTAARAAPGVVLAAAYALLCGDALKRWPPAAGLRLGILAAFLILLAYLWKTGHRHTGPRHKIRLEPGIAKAIVLFLAMPVAVIGLGMATGHFPPLTKGAAFLGDILISSVTSFGGGEAYVAVADSIFVQGGMVPADVFYNRIVPVANALPGPILVKIAAAIGFVWGHGGDSLGEGLILAAAAATVAAGACCALALLVLNFYESLKHSVFVLSLKRYILPVICGTLISTSLSMLYESMKISGAYGCRPAPTLLVMALCVGATFWIHSRFKIHDILLLLGWTGLSLLFMGWFGA